MAILSRFGIGAATVDLRLPHEVEQGETVDATVHVEGGDEEQEVEQIYAALRSEYVDDEDYHHEYTIQRYTLVEDSFTIHPGEERDFEVELHIPRETPVTTITSHHHGVPVWIDTGLDVEWSLDPDDEDMLEVHPGKEFEALHKALTDHLGFHAQDSEIEQRTGWEQYGLEVDYHPGRNCNYDLEELEVLFKDSDEHGLHVRLEIEEDGFGLFDEEYRELTVDRTDPQRVAEQVRRTIED